jgi:hypothetical protein
MPITGKWPVFLEDKGDFLINMLLSVTTLYCYVGTLMKLISILLSFYGALTCFHAMSSPLLVCQEKWVSMREGYQLNTLPTTRSARVSLFKTLLKTCLTQLALPAFRLLSPQLQRTEISWGHHSRKIMQHCCSTTMPGNTHEYCPVFISLLHLQLYRRSQGVQHTWKNYEIIHEEQK